ncbi:MAG: hypothetical protein L0H84_20465 [Pseudonocardia sp.]|nr:hypothetical protein [Pseudonocardia sp.]
MTELARRQAELVAALVANGPDPDGFDPARLAATRRALLRKRAGEAAKAWPVLAASHGGAWPAVFAAHRSGHPPVGALRDGWDVALALRAAGRLTPEAAEELAARASDLRYDGISAPTPRRWRRLRSRVIRRGRL